MAKEENNTPSKIASISIKTLGFNAKEIRKLVDDNKEMQFLARIGGVVVESFTGESKHGDYIGFKGIFTCINRNKEIYTSTLAFLPGNIAKKLAEALGQGVIEVEFTTDVFVTETNKNASGYSYICEPVLSDDAKRKADSISARVIGSKLPLALAAPVKKAS